MPRYSNFKNTQARDDRVLDKETVVYATINDLPLTDVFTGTKAYIQSTNKLYIFNNGGWNQISLINTNPSASFDSSSYIMDSAGGTPTVLTLTASDPEGIPLTYSYSFSPSNIVDSAIDYAADSSILTLTATSLSGSYNFTVTGSASDGVNIAIDTANVNLTLQSIVSIDRSHSSINEGSTVTFTLNTVEYTNGSTVPYTITGITSADINGASLTGNFTVNNNQATLVLTATEDNLSEGTETIIVSVDEGSNGSASNTCSISDTSRAISYSWSSIGNFGPNEGTTLSFQGRVYNSSETMYWNFTGTSDVSVSSGTLTKTGPFTSGLDTYYNHNGSFVITADNTTEGNETFTLNLRSGSTSGTIRDTASIEIQDTSISPPSTQFGDNNSWNLVSTGWGSSSLGLRHLNGGGKQLLIPDSFSNSATIRAYNAGGTGAGYTNGWLNSFSASASYTNGSSIYPYGMNIQESGTYTAGAILYDGNNVFYSSSANFSSMTQVTSPYNPMTIRGYSDMYGMGALPNLNFTWVYGQDPDNPYTRTTTVEFQFQPAAFGQYGTNTNGLGYNSPYSTASPTPPAWYNNYKTTSTYDTVNNDLFIAASNTVFTNPTGIQRWHWPGSGSANYADSIAAPGNGNIRGLQIIGDYMFALDTAGNIYSLLRG